jgi:diguanylate cyclase (GGDEF)-like protein
LIDFSKFPDLIAIALLTCAFASVARRNDHPGSGLWLLGWCMIVLHFLAMMLIRIPGWVGNFSLLLTLSTLTWAGTLFMRATVAYRHERASWWMCVSFLGANTFYIATWLYWPASAWMHNVAAAQFAILPLVIVYSQQRRKQHRLRWAFVTQNCLLAVVLLAMQQMLNQPAHLVFNVLLFSTYLGCCYHFAAYYRKLTTGAFISLFGFLAWALIFALAPMLHCWFPHLAIEDEVWNLPKYVVAAGMILLVLERQIEHNEYLALHDDLTGLPNRRLFQDRLQSALARARRHRQHTALLLIDLNHFKQVNDELGHHIGDMLLKRVGVIFQSRIRCSDTVARTGGDEFSVILEEPISRTDAERVAQALAELLEEPIELGDYTVHTGASIGIAMFPEDALTPETLAIAADQRMYDVKHEYRQMEEDSLALLTDELS